MPAQSIAPNRSILYAFGSVEHGVSLDSASETGLCPHSIAPLVEAL